MNAKGPESTALSSRIIGSARTEAEQARGNAHRANDYLRATLMHLRHAPPETRRIVLNL